MLKHFRSLQILFTLLLGTAASQLSAHAHPCAGHFAFSGDFLYVLPTVDETYFVIDASASSNDGVLGTRKNNEFGFKPGFRVGGMYRFACRPDQEVEVYYSRLGATTQRTVDGGNLSFTVPFIGINNGGDVLNFAGFVTSDLDLLYQRVDGFFTQALFCCFGLDFRALAGAEFAYIRLDENYFVENVGATTTIEAGNQSKAWGIGPEFGFTVDYNICQFACCGRPSTLMFTGYASGSLLAAETREEQTNLVSGGTPTDVRDNSTWRLIPAWHARLGLNYAMGFSCVAASLEVGYEFNTYLRSIGRLSPTDAIFNFVAVTDYRNFDTQGLYISAAFTF